MRHRQDWKDRQEERKKRKKTTQEKNKENDTQLYSRREIDDVMCDPCPSVTIPPAALPVEEKALLLGSLSTTPDIYQASFTPHLFMSVRQPEGTIRSPMACGDHRFTLRSGALECWSTCVTAAETET